MIDQFLGSIQIWIECQSEAASIIKNTFVSFRSSAIGNKYVLSLRAS